MQRTRRVITGLDSQGRSCILFDDEAERVIWTTDQSLADNSGATDAGGGPVFFPTEGTLFGLFNVAPGRVTAVHATDTIDYIIVICGEVTFVTETGETVLRAGDVIVDRGHVHAWRNDTGEVCRALMVLCAAHPVGKGATMSGVMKDSAHPGAVR